MNFRALAISLCLFSLAPTVAVAATAPVAAGERLIAFEKARRDAVARHDLKALAAMSAPALVYVDASGIERNRAAYLDHIAVEGVTYKSYSLDDLQAKVLGDRAVLTGVFRFDVDVQGRSSHGVQYFTAVYVRAGASWQLAIWHPTKATDLP